MGSDTLKPAPPGALVVWELPDGEKLRGGPNARAAAHSGVLPAGVYLWEAAIATESGLPNRCVTARLRVCGANGRVLVDAKDKLSSKERVQRVSFAVGRSERDVVWEASLLADSLLLGVATTARLLRVADPPDASPVVTVTATSTSPSAEPASSQEPQPWLPSTAAAAAATPQGDLQPQPQAAFLSALRPGRRAAVDSAANASPSHENDSQDDDEPDADNAGSDSDSDEVAKASVKPKRSLLGQLRRRSKNEGTSSSGSSSSSSLAVPPSNGAGSGDEAASDEAASAVWHVDDEPIKAGRTLSYSTPLPRGIYTLRLKKTDPIWGPTRQLECVFALAVPREPQPAVTPVPQAAALSAAPTAPPVPPPPAPLSRNSGGGSTTVITSLPTVSSHTFVVSGSKSHAQEFEVAHDCCIGQLSVKCLARMVPMKFSGSITPGRLPATPAVSEPTSPAAAGAATAAAAASSSSSSSSKPQSAAAAQQQRDIGTPPCCTIEEDGER